MPRAGTTAAAHGLRRVSGEGTAGAVIKFLPLFPVFRFRLQMSAKHMLSEAAPAPRKTQSAYLQDCVALDVEFGGYVSRSFL
jgi:hypothetical protein